jgi:hypothetical protein
METEKTKGSSGDVDKNGEMPVAAGDLEKELLETGDHEDSRCSSFWTWNFVAISWMQYLLVGGRKRSLQSIYTVCLVPMHPTYKSRHFKSVMWKPNMFLGE